MNASDFHKLLIKTSFACMVCDGEIVEQEKETIRAIFIDSNIEDILNQYIVESNTKRKQLLKEYLVELSKEDLSEEEELDIIKTALETIYADFDIKYSEIRFFKIIRSKLKITNEKILSAFPNKEIFLEKSFYAIKLRLPEIDQFLEKEMLDIQGSQKLSDDYFNTINLQKIEPIHLEDIKDKIPKKE